MTASLVLPHKVVKKVNDKFVPINDGKDIYIITGSYGNQNSLYPGHPLVANGVTIPDRLWKIAIILDKPGYRLQDIDASAISEVIAIDVPNRSDSDSIFTGKTGYADWLTTINSLEQNTKTGLSFLNNLPESLQAVIKS